MGCVPIMTLLANLILTNSVYKLAIYSKYHSQIDLGGNCIANRLRTGLCSSGLTKSNRLVFLLFINYLYNK